MLGINQMEENLLSLFCSLCIFFLNCFYFFTFHHLKLQHYQEFYSLLWLWCKKEEVHIHFKAHPQPWSLSWITEYGIVMVGKNLWRSSSPNSLLRIDSDRTDCLGHLGQSLSISKGGDYTTPLGNLFYCLPCSQAKLGGFCHV